MSRFDQPLPNGSRSSCGPTPGEPHDCQYQHTHCRSKKRDPDEHKHPGARQRLGEPSLETLGQGLTFWRVQIGLRESLKRVNERIPLSELNRAERYATR